MFARSSTNFLPDAPFKPDLKELGYFITDDGDLRSIRDPSKGFHYAINKVSRWNDVNREAMRICMRAEYHRRFESEGIAHFFLPQMTTTKPSDPHVPILTTPLDALRKKTQVLVIVNGHMQDLGVWAWRLLEHEHGSLNGTALGLAKKLNHCAKEQPGMIVANLGQLLFSHKYQCAVTRDSWNSLPRASAVHPSPKIHPEHNIIPGNENPEAHLRFILENVVLNPDLVAKDAEIYVVGLSRSADVLIELFNSEWSKYSPRITAIGLTSPSTMPERITNSDFKTFLAERARSWESAYAPLNVCTDRPEPTVSPAVNSSSASTNTGDTDPGPQWGLGDDGPIQQLKLCPTFSGGDEFIDELVFPRVYPHVVDWFFNEVGINPAGYKNPELEIFKTNEEVGQSDQYDGASEPLNNVGAGPDLSVVNEPVVDEEANSEPMGPPRIVVEDAEADIGDLA
ncbi:MAG: hypothetical protein Q9157_004074 [Trypethelium eluteriae]